MGHWEIKKPETRGHGVVVKILSLLAFTFALIAAAIGSAPAQRLSASHRTALAAIERWPAGATASARGNEPDLLLAGLDAVWQNTVDRRLILSIESAVDLRMGTDGSHAALSESAHQSAVAPLGSLLLRLYGVTQDRRYYQAATQLYDQLTASAQAPAGQLPFLAEYAATFHHAEAFAGLTEQLTKASGQGCTRALAWKLWAVADSLPFYAADDPGRGRLLAVLAREAQIATSTQDPSTGLWLKDAPHAAVQGKNPDLVSSGLIVYALARSVRLGYLPERDLAPVARAYKTLLGRANSLADPQQTGAYLLAASEMENAQNVRLGRGKTVVVDGWFNSQMHADATGRQIYFHYKWDDQSNNGFSLLGRIIRNDGADTGTLYVAPTAENLRGAQVYIVVSPDIPSKNPHPHYIQAEDGAQIADWVRAGGVLVLLANDPANTDLDGMNRIADQFGMHFSSVLLKHVIGDQYEMGKIVVAGGGAIFRQPHTLFMKDVCSIAVTAPAVSVLSENGNNWMAVAHYGKGTVYANVDPWLYNEYTDGRKLPAEYDNYAGGAELVRWVLQQIPRTAAIADSTRNPNSTARSTAIK
jgi:unsaturated rhamnogalacturonyl hydrolase